MENPFDPNPFAGHTACCFTGHRPAGLPQSAGGMAALRLALMRVVQAACDGGVRTFLAGGAQGFDQLAAEAVLLLRDGLPDVRLLLALPSPAQADGWSDAARARYDETLRRADGVWYAATGAPDAAAMRRRNRYLADHADCCIAYLQAVSGGTLYTVRYALARGLFVCNLAEFVKA